MTTSEAEIVVGRGRPEQVILRRADNEDGLALVLVLQESTGQLRTIGFRGVTALRFLGESTTLTQRTVLIARDVSQDQWEGVRFAVRDAEGEFLSFWCESFEDSPATLAPSEAKEA